MNNVDASLNKRWRLNERGAEISLRGEALNACNRVQFSNLNTDQFNSAFGQINSASNYPRQMQVVLRAGF